MSDIQRYDAWPQDRPFEDKNGEFVTYGDHIKIVKELEAKLAKAVEALNDMVKECEEELLPSHGYIKYFCCKTLAEIDLCPSCREPLSLPSGDGCAAMAKHSAGGSKG
jgi:hypothetical protein